MTFSIEQRLRYLADLEHSEENFGSIPPTLLTDAADRIAELEAALIFYADPVAWKKQHDPEDVVCIPDFYSEYSFGDTAAAAIQAKVEK